MNFFITGRAHSPYCSASNKKVFFVHNLPTYLCFTDQSSVEESIFHISEDDFEELQIPNELLPYHPVTPVLYTTADLERDRAMQLCAMCKTAKFTYFVYYFSTLNIETTTIN